MTDLLASSRRPTAVAVVRESLLDVIHRGDGTVHQHPGGSPANVAVALGRLGRHPHLMTCLGDDYQGFLIRIWLESSGVYVVHPSQTGVPTSTAVAQLDDSGIAEYRFDFSWCQQLDVHFRAGVVHSGSLAALHDSSASHIVQVLARVRDEALISYDPNVRPSALPDRKKARMRVERLVRSADIVKVSRKDLKWLYPNRTSLAVALDWQAVGPAIVVVTAGGDGATAVTMNDCIHIPAHRVTAVDTVGAGDAFTAALLDGFIEAGYSSADDRERLADVDADTVKRILSRSCAAAALSTSRPGADPPWLYELDSFDPAGEEPDGTPTTSTRGL